MLPDSVMRWTEWPACKAELLSRGWEAENGIVHRTHTSLHCCSKHSLGIIPQVACRICKTLAEPALVHDAQLQAILRQQGLPTQAAKQSQPAQRNALRSLAASAVQAPRVLRQQGLPILVHSSTYRGSSALPLQCQAAILVWVAASCTPALAYTRCHPPRLPHLAGQGLENGVPKSE